jgi:hypothetical protein
MELGGGGGGLDPEVSPDPFLGSRTEMLLFSILKNVGSFNALNQLPGTASPSYWRPCWGGSCGRRRSWRPAKNWPRQWGAASTAAGSSCPAAGRRADRTASSSMFRSGGFSVIEIVREYCSSRVVRFFAVFFVSVIRISLDLLTFGRLNQHEIICHGSASKGIRYCESFGSIQRVVED